MIQHKYSNTLYYTKQAKRSSFQSDRRHCWICQSMESAAWGYSYLQASRLPSIQQTS